MNSVSVISKLFGLVFFLVWTQKQDWLNSFQLTHPKQGEAVQVKPLSLVLVTIPKQQRATELLPNSDSKSDLLRWFYLTPEGPLRTTASSAPRPSPPPYLGSRAPLITPMSPPGSFSPSANHIQP